MRTEIRSRECIAGPDLFRTPARSDLDLLAILATDPGDFTQVTRFVTTVSAELPAAAPTG